MLYPQIRGKILKHLKLLSKHDPTHFHQSQWEIQSQYRHSMFISANLFCSLRIFFSWLFFLQERAKKKKKKRKKEKEKKKKRFSKFSFSLPKSYLQVMRCMARHVLQPNTMSPHHAAHFCRDYLPLFWIFISFLPSSIILSPFLLSQ